MTDERVSARNLVRYLLVANMADTVLKQERDEAKQASLKESSRKKDISKKSSLLDKAGMPSRDTPKSSRSKDASVRKPRLLELDKVERTVAKAVAEELGTGMLTKAERKNLSKDLELSSMLKLAGEPPSIQSTFWLLSSDEWKAIVEEATKDTAQKGTRGKSHPTSPVLKVQRSGRVKTGPQRYKVVVDTGRVGALLRHLLGTMDEDDRGTLESIKTLLCPELDGLLGAG
ncbi:hypothetical protein J8273_4297 [Carpediemonas membranifera]|uniref:Uncharacterized protein n=1 Tax=Carpediemonas membranifera TaxID=201153 RepID=A0A8J6EA42_9EUKA|nr:hypothetical protein J8273_4297 [Carpediemonas membranifera]|eukprot:KAG9394195.1 hypothetical protein J8273_4297 [Carpediemonas membranifera]